MLQLTAFLGAGKISLGHTTFKIHEAHLSLAVGFGVGFLFFVLSHRCD